jgi:hypothetical protein
VKRVAATREFRRRLDTPRTDAVHPHHRSLAQTMACGECMRRFWEAQGQLERLIPSGLTCPPNARMAAGSDLFKGVG